MLTPQVAQVQVNRIQAPGYIPPPLIVRRPWWFTVQTVSGPGAVVPVPQLTHYRPGAFRFPSTARYLPANRSLHRRVLFLHNGPQLHQ